MIDPIHIRAITDRAMAQIRDGVAAARAGDVILYELHFSLAQETLRRLVMMTHEQKPPLRKMALVVMPRDEELPEWMSKKHGGNDDAA
jgi:Tfp pilus assembly pilus retraction ATPase PilT